MKGHASSHVQSDKPHTHPPPLLFTAPRWSAADSRSQCFAVCPAVAEVCKGWHEYTHKEHEVVI